MKDKSLEERVRIIENGFQSLMKEMETVFESYKLGVMSKDLLMFSNMWIRASAVPVYRYIDILTVDNYGKTNMTIPQSRLNYDEISKSSSNPTVIADVGRDSLKVHGYLDEDDFLNVKMSSGGANYVTKFITVVY